MTSIPQSQQAFARPAALVGLLLAVAAIITGCAAATIADHMPAAVGGLPEGAPSRPETPSAYPAVHDMPPPRRDTVLTSEEQQKVEDDLVAARNRAATAGGSAGKSAGKPAGKSDGKPDGKSAGKSDGKADGSARNP